MINRYIRGYPILFFFALAQIIFVSCICGVYFFPDSGGYINAVNFITTGSGNVHLHRLLRPLGPLLAAVFTPFVGNVTNGFLAENSIFLILSSGLIFLITKEIYNNEKVALFSSILFSSSWIVLFHGLAVLTDMGAYFFITLDIYLTLLFFKKDRDYKFLLVLGLICGLGLLMKENSVVGALFFVLMLLLSKNAMKRKIEWLFVFSFAFLIPILINSAIIYYFFNYTYLDWYLYNVGEYATTHNYIYIIFGLGSVFNMIFPFFVIGLYNQLKNKANLKLYISLLISSFIPVLLWPVQSDPRFSFIVFIGMIPLSSYGIKLFCDYFDTQASKIAITILVIGILFAYVFVNMSIRFALSYYGLEIFSEIWHSLVP